MSEGLPFLSDNPLHFAADEPNVGGVIVNTIQLDSRVIWLYLEAMGNAPDPEPG